MCDRFAFVCQNDRKFLHNLEMGVRHGKWILIENIPDRLDVSLEPLLMQQTFWHGGSELINVGEHIVPYNDRFKVFLTTRLANPHFTPELCAKVSVLNFSITPEGLLDQMLGVFVVRPSGYCFGSFARSALMSVRMLCSGGGNARAGGEEDNANADERVHEGGTAGNRVENADAAVCFRGRHP